MASYNVFPYYSVIPYSMVVDWNAYYLRGLPVRRSTYLDLSRRPLFSTNAIEDTLMPETQPFRLMDLPFEIRKEIFFLAITSSDNFWLDREVITFGESLQGNRFIRGRIIWRGSNGCLPRLLITNKQVQTEVEELLYSRFAFDARGWGYTLKYSDPSKTPNRLPKHRIKHIVYTPYLTKYMREHRQAAELILSHLPMLCTIRIMITWQCTQNMLVRGHTETGTQHIVEVAHLFRQIGKVAIIGQSLAGDLEKKLVEDAREALKDEPWYWELNLDYPLFVPSFQSNVESHL